MTGFDFLLHARKFGIKLGLETMQRLAEALGNPESELKFIHIAGTNGKGSTTAFCAQTLQEAGFRTGLFTSPHLISVTERIQLNGTPIPETTLTSLLDEIAEITRAWEISPTFFEILTACALLFFKREKVEWVVWETGMGGRLDSTNIVTPEVSVITQIGFDHQEFLGETLFKIAMEKAGIIKQGIPTVCGVRDPESLAVIQGIAQKRKSPWIDTHDLIVNNRGIRKNRQHVEIEGIPFQLSLLGEHQIQNSLTAFTVLFALLKIPIKTIQRGFSKTVWPGRFQILRKNPPLVLDGAHNISSAKMLVETWKAAFGEIKPLVVFGVMEDKSHAEITEEIKSIAQEIVLVKPDNPRAMDPEALVSSFAPLPTHIEPHLRSYWPQLFSTPRPILITGSLFLIGEVLQLHQATTVNPDLTLNEIVKPSSLQ